MVVFYLEAERRPSSKIDYLAKLDARRVQACLTSGTLGMAVIPTELLNGWRWLRHAARADVAEAPVVPKLD
jgi:hypothetical protein